jgi:hypothetical protein
VTIQKRGTISMNRAAYVALDSPDTVELLYDLADRVVGLRAVDHLVEHAYPVRSVGADGSSYLIAGTAFTKYYGIDTEVSRRWPAELQDGVLCVDLKEDGTIVTSNRSAKPDRRSATR